MTVIQFMLGVDAPVSFLLIEEIILQVLVNCLIALPVYEIVRRLLYPALPRDPTSPPSPRLLERAQPLAAPV